MQLLFAYASLALALSAAANPLSARDDSTTCTSPIVVSTQTAQVGNNTVLLELLACPPGVVTASTNGLVANTIGSDSGLGNVLCHLLPFIFCPPKPYIPKPYYPPPPPPPKTTTKVKTITTTTTDTATKTIVTTVTETDTITATVVATPSPTPSPVDVCGEVCDVSCSGEVEGQLPPTSDDCQVIIESIQIFEGNSAPTFVVEPLHIQQLTFGTCRFFFENLGSFELEYCWQDLANMGSLAATTCFPPVMPLNSLAICEAQDTTWEVGVSHS